MATTSKIQKRDVIAEIKINVPSKTNVYRPASFTKLAFLLMRILKSRISSDSQKEHSDKDLMDTNCHFQIKTTQTAPNYQNMFLKLKNSDTDQNKNIKWSIVTKAAPYNNGSKYCNLCLTDKLFITKAEKSNTLNKRSELISKCGHETNIT